MGTRLHESIEENTQGVVAAVGEQKFPGTNAEVPRDARRRFLILGIHCKLLGSEFCNCLEHGNSATRSIFVEVETNLSGPSLGRRFIGFAIEDGLTDGQ